MEWSRWDVRLFAALPVLVAVGLVALALQAWVVGLSLIAVCFFVAMLAVVSMAATPRRRT